MLRDEAVGLADDRDALVRQKGRGPQLVENLGNGGLVAVHGEQAGHALLRVEQLIQQLLAPGADQRLVLARNDVNAITHDP